MPIRLKKGSKLKREVTMYQITLVLCEGCRNVFSKIEAYDEKCPYQCPICKNVNTREQEIESTNGVFFTRGEI